ncbi:hypothetical protein EMEDMD4_370100 [Sinorhizobium medicae]|uniref:Uncharacterized protein n=1 Tax=Sinorhizobium medicae TaxID=110321 RepID=A0A508WYJ4_9HYPH|nr:hypothetical protein EMEDMD4_370100 [Sinorhizobium medicae]
MLRFMCSRNSSAVISRTSDTVRSVCLRATVASSSSVRPMMQKPVQHIPVPSRTSLSVISSSPSERNTLARLAGPHRDPFDCHEIFDWKVAATGSVQARSINSGTRITEDRITSSGTLGGLAAMKRAAASPQRPTTAPSKRRRFISVAPPSRST